MVSTYSRRRRERLSSIERRIAARRWAGILRVSDLRELFDCAETLGRVGPPGGKRLAILTNGGGGTTSLSMLVIKQIRGGFHSASALSTIVFLLVALTAFLFIKFGGADVVQRPPTAKKPKKPDAQVGNPVAANATSTGA